MTSKDNLNPEPTQLDNVSESGRELEMVQVPMAILDLIVELSSEGQLDATRGAEIVNPKLMELSSKVYQIAHWYASPACRKNHPSWNPGVEEPLETSSNKSNIRSLFAPDVKSNQ